jgi:abortive infection bacteriophage resistance protein
MACPSSFKNVRVGFLYSAVQEVHMSSCQKPHLSYQQQLSLLKSRGLVITDSISAIKYLKTIGYYRLSGYWYSFREIDIQNKMSNHEHKRKDNFVKNTKFQDIISLYVFDRRLRILLLDAIERIEVSVRVEIAHLLGKHDIFAYLNPELLHGHFVKKQNKFTGKTEFEKWLSNLDQHIKRSNEEFVKHYKEKYGLPLPIWVAIELWDFGMLSKFYQGMRVNHKQEIAKRYGINNWQVMQSWLRCLNYIRNCVAHHGRLWNRNMVEYPKFPSYDELPHFNPLINNTRAHSRVYGVLCITLHLIKQINPDSSWKQRVAQLTDTFPTSESVSLSNMGFPENWKNHKIWDLEVSRELIT